MNLKALCLSISLMIGAACAFAQSSTVYNLYPANYVLATNLSAVAKFSTNNFAGINTSNTFLSKPVPLPTSDRGLQITAQFVPAGSLIGTSNLVVGFEFSDGVTYTSTTDPLTVTLVNTIGSNICATYFFNRTNYYGHQYIIPDYVSNQGLTNGTLSITYGFLSP